MGSKTTETISQTTSNVAQGTAGRAAFENNVFRRGPVIVAVIKIAPKPALTMGDR